MKALTVTGSMLGSGEIGLIAAFLLDEERTGLADGGRAFTFTQWLEKE